MGYQITVDDDIDEVVEAQLGELDVFEFVKGSKLPTAEVTVYTDADAALRLDTLLQAEQARNAEREELEKQGFETLSIADEDVVDDAELNELHERLTASALIFSLEGLAPGAYDALEKSVRATSNYKDGTENVEYVTALNTALLGKSIRSVRTAAGQASNAVWTAEKTDKFTTELYPSESNKLFLEAQRLTYVQNIFDRAVSADFS